MSSTGETATPGPGEETAIEAYTRTYQEHHSRLVAYARTLTGDAWLAEDLTAEAHFRVWRRISAGHQVDHIPGYLAATIRNLAVDLGHAPKELPQGDQLERLQPAETTTTPAPQDGAYVVMLAGALKQLPHRWIRALWLTEVEDWSLEAVGDDLGTNRNATAVLLHRAREGLRQAFLRAQPGAPGEAGCAEYWERMPAHVRGTSSARQDRTLRAHADGCPDCRSRLALLERANHRLPALVGPALLLAFAGSAARYLIPSAGARAAARGHGAGHGAGRSGHAASSSGPASGSVGTGTLAVAGGLVLAAAGAVAAFTLTGSHASPQPTALATQQGTSAPATAPASTASGQAQASSASTSTAPAPRTAAATVPTQESSATAGSEPSSTVANPSPSTAPSSAEAEATTEPTSVPTATTPAAAPSTSSSAPAVSSPTSALPSPTTASPTPSEAPTSPSDSPSPTVVATTPAPSTTAASPSASPTASTDPTCWTLGGLSVCWSR